MADSHHVKEIVVGDVAFESSENVTVDMAAADSCQ